MDESDLHLTEDESFTDTDLDEDFLTESETDSNPDQSTDSSVRKETAVPPSTDKPAEHIVKPIGEKIGSLPLDQIPLSLIVEVGRIQITMQKLLELEPGNLLELTVRPEDGVDLVVNGKRAGRGELIRIGETLGIRILELGK